MCGILGIYNVGFSKNFIEEKFEKALLTMRHRGPDGNAVKAFGKSAILGHLRLSIIDLSCSNNQPLQVDERYWIVYNGEIYNYLELKAELIGAGHVFRTAGDTEVLLRAYQHWGEDCVKKFNGMWAFAIYDSETNKLFCSRDRFGIKPFNYATVDDQFIFSSEIKAIISYFPQVKVPNYNVIANFCRKSTGGQLKETWFVNIFRLEPAHNLVIDSLGVNIYRYWDYPCKVDNQISFDEATEKYRQLLVDSVRLRMRSDVPVGFTLSSGIDSSSLICLLKNKFNGNKSTYTAAFTSTKFEQLESQHIRNNLVINEPSIVRKLTAELDLTPHIIEVSYESYVDKLTMIIKHTEAGHASPAIFPLSQILEEAKKEVKVVLEGQGADELLGGYLNSFFPPYFIELLRGFKLKTAFRELTLFLKVYSLPATVILFIRQSNFSLFKKMFYKFSGNATFYKNELRNFCEIKDYPEEPMGFDNSLNKNLFKAHTGVLVNLLQYGDSISMMNSLESRLPFMDYRLVEFAFTLPSKFKIRNGLGKYIHRRAMQNIVPGYIIDNPVKFGFDSPMSHIFEMDDDDSARALLLSDKCINRGLFSQKALTRAFEEQKKGKVNHTRILFRLLCVELWFRVFID